MPAAAALRRNSDVFSSFLNTEADHAGDFSSRNKNTAPDSACRPGLTAAGSSSCKLPTPTAKQGGQSPKLTKLHQQVTQFKLLRLAQNKGTHTDTITTKFYHNAQLMQLAMEIYYRF